MACLNDLMLPGSTTPTPQTFSRIKPILPIRTRALSGKLELLIWLAGIAFLFFIDPSSRELPDLCLFRFVGLEGCPGCGLGRSVSYLLHGNLAMSLNSHYLGVLALSVLLHRIYILGKQAITITGKEQPHA